MSNTSNLSGPNTPNLAGHCFGLWSVLKRLPNNRHRMTMWLCRCSCGTERPVLGSSLFYGKSASCGCARKIDPDRPVKRCTTCQVTKPIGDFGMNKSRNDGHHTECRSCVAEGNANRAPARAEWKLRRNYGIGLKDKGALIEAQGGRCPLCLRNLSSPVVDHDHATNRIRGVLCRNCNTWLGAIEADPGRIDRALEYLLTGADHVKDHVLPSYSSQEE